MTAQTKVAAPHTKDDHPRVNDGASDASSVSTVPLSGVFRHALVLTRRGFHVFPLRPRGKEPACQWTTEATTDQETVRGWFERDPELNVGVACGPSHLLVVDEDVPGDLDRWCTDHGVTLPETFTVATAHGRHLYFDQGGRGLGNSSPFKRDGYGIDVRGVGGYVVGPGSTHPSGARYRSEKSLRPADLPEALADYLAPRPRPAGPEVRASGTPRRPGDVFEERATWAEILEPHGWQVSGHEGRETYWTRPGKDPREGHSASTGRESDRDRLYVFSTSTPFDPEVPVSKFHAYAVLNHDGDESAAARALARAGDRQDWSGFRPVLDTGDASTDNDERFTHLMPGGEFVYDMSTDVPPLWGDAETETVLWARGESLMLYGGVGVGKSTLAGQLVRARMGMRGDLLGMPVVSGEARVLYLAMDRPRQIGRSMRRQFSDREREAVEKRLAVWNGPLPGSLVQEPTLLLEMARTAGADTLVVDSLKDLGLKLSDEEGGTAYNLARQHLLAEGVEVLELHHARKAPSEGRGRLTQDDVYGSVHLAAGAGGILALHTGRGGVLVLDAVKTPAGSLERLSVRIDYRAGTVRVGDSPDEGAASVVAVLANLGRPASAPEVAREIHGEPLPADVERVRRRLESAVRLGDVVKYGGKFSLSGGVR